MFGLSEWDAKVIVAVIWSSTVLYVIFGGEPDLMNALFHYINFVAGTLE